MERFLYAEVSAPVRAHRTVMVDANWTCAGWSALHEAAERRGLHERVL